MTSDEDLRNELSAKDREIAALLDEVIGGVPQELVEKVDDLEQCVLSMEDQNAKLYRQLNKVTAERDRLDKLYVGELKEVARLEDELADVGLYLDKLLRAVEAWRDSYSRPLREPYNEALAENAAIALVTLAAKIRKERS